MEYEFASRQFKRLGYSAHGVTDYHATLGDKWLFHGLRIYDTDHHHLDKIPNESARKFWPSLL